MTEQTQTIHQQCANFIGAKMQTMDIKVSEMQDMTTALGWLQAIVNGKLQIVDLNQAEVGTKPDEQDEAA